MPLDWVRVLSGVSLVVPYYHMVSSEPVPHVSPLYRFRTIAEFTADVEFLLRQFEPVSLSDVVAMLNGERRRRNRPSFHLTFDDGFRENYEIIAPILERVGVPATFFLNTAFLDGRGLAHHNIVSLLLDRIESAHSGPSRAALQLVESLLSGEPSGATLRKRLLSIRYAQNPLVHSIAAVLEVDIAQYVRETQPYLSSDQILRLIRRGFDIGGHSHDHPLYADLSLREQLDQTRASVELLDRQFGLGPKSFAFPHTDTGVGKAFFTSVFSEKPFLDVTFGTSGLIRHFHPRNIERVSMEKTSAPVAQILARQFARAVYCRARNLIGAHQNYPMSI